MNYQTSFVCEMSAQYEIKSLAAKNTSELWDAEYSSHPTIPSSHRLEPSHALTSIIDSLPIDKGAIVDLGSGNGRNAAFLAKIGFDVTCLDFSKIAIYLASERVKKDGLSSNIKILNHDIMKGLPFAGETIDVVLDSYFSCHLIDVDTLNETLSECSRVLKQGGYFIKIHLDNTDPYYRSKAEHFDEFGFISFDSANNIRKRHFSLEDYLKVSAPFFVEVKSIPVRFVDKVDGIDFERSIFVSLMRRN